MSTEHITYVASVAALQFLDQSYKKNFLEIIGACITALDSFHESVCKLPNRKQEKYISNNTATVHMIAKILLKYLMENVKGSVEIRRSPQGTKYGVAKLEDLSFEKVSSLLNAQPKKIMNAVKEMIRTGTALLETMEKIEAEILKTVTEAADFLLRG